jgi:hypothetical protein
MPYQYLIGISPLAKKASPDIIFAELRNSSRNLGEIGTEMATVCSVGDGLLVRFCGDADDGFKQKSCTKVSMTMTQ